MKGKELISAALGSAFFAVPYLALATPLAPSIIIGAAAFGASELVFSSFKPKKTLKDTNVSLYEKIVVARKENKQIALLIPKIEDGKLRDELKEINSTVDKIINEVEKNPKKADNIKNFFDYYLPVLLKIVNRYDEIENQNLISSDGKAFIKKANEMIKNTTDAFNTILASLYQKDILDASSDMKIYDMMLKADGITSDNLIMKAGESNEK